MENKRFCRKCLLREQEAAAYASVEELLAAMDPAIKAPEAVYEKRLNICKNCPKFFGGLCRACGCFVELRAAVLEHSCPDSGHFW